MGWFPLPFGENRRPHRVCRANFRSSRRLTHGSYRFAILGRGRIGRPSLVQQDLVPLLMGNSLAQLVPNNGHNVVIRRTAFRCVLYRRPRGEGLGGVMLDCQYIAPV